MHPKVAMFLRERDRAIARGDAGIVRCMTVELNRLGVPETATLANPTGTKRQPKDPEVDPAKRGRPKLPRCEHGSVADRCVECNPELEAA